MSAIGSAKARGPEMWSDTAAPPSLLLVGSRRLGGVGGLVQQRLEGRLLQRRGGLRVVEHLLERLVHPQGLADLLDRAGIVPRVSSRGSLRAQDQRLHRRDIWQAFVAFGVLEDGVEQLQRRP